MADWGATLCSRTLVEIERTIELELRSVAASAGPQPVLLDIGCWDGSRTLERAEAVGARTLQGVEIFAGPAEEASARGVDVARIDLERERLPLEDASVDVVICNQVLEHLKNIWLPMSEMHRVLRRDGHAVLSVPNLASLHNRALLALGRQPTSIRVLGPHIRGYAFREFCDLVALGGAYEIERKLAVGFYPLPSRLSRPVARLWPGAGHSTVVVARKVSDRGGWSDQLSEALDGGVQTLYPGETAPGSS
jgi:SAM-dependent methyltransferase